MRRFLSQKLPTSTERVVLDQQTSHHLLRVVGIAPNESVELFTGKGSGCIARLFGVTDGLAEMAWVTQLEEAPLRPQVSLVLAVTKGDAFATAIRMTTELGVAQIFPLQSQRTIPKGDKQQRWQKIANGAAAQSKRLQIPTVHSLRTWEQLWDVLPPGSRWVLHPHGESQSIGQILESTTIFIGPEGGFTDSELSMMLEQGCEQRSLGTLVLRADTAAVAVLSRNI